jgi:GntR family transcriptional regulator
MIQDPTGFLENGVGHHNRLVTTQVVSARQEPFPDHACRVLRLPEGSEGLVLVRLRFLDGMSVLVGTNYVPPHVEGSIRRASDVLRGEASLTQALAREGFVTYGAQRIIHALGAPVHIAQKLGVPEGMPLVRIRSATWDESMVPFDYYETWLRTDVVPLEVTTTSVATPSAISRKDR